MKGMLKYQAVAYTVALVGFFAAAALLADPSPDPVDSAFDAFISTNPSVVRWVWGGLAACIVSLAGIILYFAKATWRVQTETTTNLAAQIGGLSKLHHADMAAVKDIITASIRELGAEMDGKLTRLVEVFAKQQQQHEHRLSRLEGEHAILHATAHLQRHSDAAKSSGENGGGD